MSEENNIDKSIQVELGSQYYHWRYGLMTVKAISGDKITLEVNDFSGIRMDEKLLDPWSNHMMEKTKTFTTSAIDKWLFKVSDRVGSSKPSYGDRQFLSDEVFLRKLNGIFNEESVMECKNNYAKYLAKAKAEKLNKTDNIPKENDEDNVINEKEIDEIMKIKEDYITRKEEKEEELEYIVNKILDYEVQLSGLEGNISRCKRKIGEKEKRIVSKENELDKIESDANNNAYSKNQGLIIDMETEIRRLEEGIDELKGEINEAGRNIEKISKEQAKLENKKNILNKEIGDLTNKITNLENDIKELV